MLTKVNNQSLSHLSYLCACFDDGHNNFVRIVIIIISFEAKETFSTGVQTV